MDNCAVDSDSEEDIELWCDEEADLSHVQYEFFKVGKI